MNGSSSSIVQDHVERSDGDELVQVDSNIGMNLRKKLWLSFHVYLNLLQRKILFLVLHVDQSLILSMSMI